MSTEAMAHCITELKQLEDMLIKCSRCGSCQAVCPLYKKDHSEASVARGKIFLIKALTKGTLEKADEIYKYIDYCLLCGRCKTNCPSGVATDEIFLKAKAIIRHIKKLPGWQKRILQYAMNKPQLLARLNPLLHVGIRLSNRKIDDGVYQARPILTPFLGTMAKRHMVDIPTKSLTQRYGGFNQAKNETRRVIFYPGCSTTLIYVHWGVAIIETLLHYGVSVYVPETNQCCGIPSATMGELALYHQQIIKNYNYFDSIDDADCIITCCPTCEYGLGELGPKETRRAQSKPIMDVIVFLVEELGLKLKEKITLFGSSTLHMPCHYKTAKKPVLLKFINDNFATNFQPLKNQGCCGFGGTFSLKNYPHTQEIGKLKAAEIRDRGFDQVFTACPGCAMNLTDANMTLGNKLKATHPIIQIYEQIVKPTQKDNDDQRHGDRPSSFR
jgi:glycolate oxidase iron-sulfur subunit